MKLIKPLFILFLVVGTSLSLRAEPFITTDKLWLRADIETLANLGVIKTPITTWPLTWGPILKDLSNAKLAEVPEEYHGAYFRVLRTGRKETGKDNSFSEVRLSFNQESQLLRGFGDKARDKREASSRVSGMTNHFAWNLEVTIAPDSVDGDDKRFDGTYLATTTGNWIFYVGQVEKWWGPGFTSSLILSNNAKPVPAISLQRNYAEPFESSILNWLGPWSFQAFAGLLDDNRTIKNAKLLGMSLAFKPLSSLEIGLRRTAQWGGEGRPENLDSLFNLFIGLDNCDEGNLSCEDLSNEPGNQLAGVDFIYRPFDYYPMSFYAQIIGEDEAGYAPSRKIYNVGTSGNVIVKDVPVWINIECSTTKSDGEVDYNYVYEHYLYQTGYRYLGRSIGSTLDNDSNSLSVSFIMQIQEYGNFSFDYKNIKLNEDNNNRTLPGGHSLVNGKTDFSEIELKWNYQTNVFGEFSINLLRRSELVDSKLGVFDRQAFGIEWIYTF